jgi:EAL domain-containing protein (putative c-di-GMP-specific phosphodiesterase class I)
VLKIDQRFVQNVSLNHADEAIIDAIITLARRLDVRVTAEGVETLDHEAAVIRLGCKHAQGFLYAPALPLDELTATITSRTPGY